MHLVGVTPPRTAPHPPHAASHHEYHVQRPESPPHLFTYRFSLVLRAWSLNGHFVGAGRRWEGHREFEGSPLTWRITCCCPPPPPSNCQPTTDTFPHARLTQRQVAHRHQFVPLCPYSTLIPKHVCAWWAFSVPVDDGPTSPLTWWDLPTSPTNNSTPHHDSVHFSCRDTTTRLIQC